jgi:hypothetical protein
LTEWPCARPPGDHSMMPLGATVRIPNTGMPWLNCADDRDRGTPRGATPPTPPGIRVAYHGGSTGLSWDRDMESGETE